MLRFLIGIFVVLHGLVHLWYFTLSQRLVEFRPEMGWTGESWLFSPLLGDTATRSLATVLYGLATLGFVIGGIGIFAHQAWWRPLVIGSAAFSTAIILLLWDGGLQMLVEKGLTGRLVAAGRVGRRRPDGPPLGGAGHRDGNQRWRSGCVAHGPK